MSSEKIVNADGALLKQLIANNELVLVDFWAAWCAPCKAMAPSLDRLAGEFLNMKVVKVDAEEHKELLEDYDVRSLPTLQLYHAGERVDMLVGKVPYPQILRAIQKVA
jgi:thioredoxin